MRIAVVGAGGRTGRHVVAQAAARGHEVVAIARRPETVAAREARAVVVAADVLDREAIGNALAGCSAVVSTLGVGTSRRPTTLYSAGIANVVTTMEGGRLAVVSAVPVGAPDEHQLLQRRVLLPLLHRLFGATYRDMERMETLLRSCEVDWVSLRPPRLVDRCATGRYRLQAATPLPRARTLTCADLATALLDAVEPDSGLHCEVAYVAN